MHMQMHSDNTMHTHAGQQTPFPDAHAHLLTPHTHTHTHTHTHWRTYIHYAHMHVHNYLHIDTYYLRAHAHKHTPVHVKNSTEYCFFSKFGCSLARRRGQPISMHSRAD